MSEISDETLMAYADGELGITERARVDACLATDPNAVERLSIFTATGKDLGHLFGEPMGLPVPQRLIDAIMVPANGGAASAVIIPFNRSGSGRRAPVAAWQGKSWALAAACLSILAVGIGSRWVVGHQPSDDSRSASAAGTATIELASALDDTPSGRTAARSIDGVPALIKPLFSFATASGDVCRQYEIRATKSRLISGVACRDSKAHWTIEKQVASDEQPATTGQITPAGKKSAAEIDAIVSRLITGDTFVGDDELAVMKNGWRVLSSEHRDPNN